MKIVLTGATGFLGPPLVSALRARGDDLTVLCRDPAKATARLGAVTAVAADLETPGPWRSALAGADAIVHLAGEPVADKRWDARQKQVIRDSRVEATRTLVEMIAEQDPKPKVLLSASGVDYYPFAGGPLDDDEVTERDGPGSEFLARVCRDWEREAAAAQPLGLRVARLRMGLVIGPSGGSLARMTAAFRRYAGGRLGNGKQWLSWIHVDDVVGVIVAALTDDRYTGPLNLVAPETVRNAAFASALGRALHKPSWLPAPAFAVRLALGEFADVVLHGRMVIPARLTELGYAWKYPTVEAALADVTK